MAWEYEHISDEDFDVFYCDNCKTELLRLKYADQNVSRYIDCQCGVEYKVDYQIIPSKRMINKSKK